MRRFSSWARSPSLIPLLVAASLPGFLFLPAGPVQAQGIAQVAEVLATGPLDIPKQMSGTAAGLPALVDTSVTQVSSGSPEVEDDPVRGALRLEERPAAKAAPSETTASKLPAGVERAEQRDRQSAVSLGSPLIDDVHPEHGALVEVTPLLSVQTTSLGGGTSADFNFFYTVCEVLEEDEDGGVVFPDPENPAPVPECVESGRRAGEDTWRVPAGELEWGKQYEWWARVVDPEGSGSARTDNQSFTTGAPQPETGAHLGERASSGQEFAPISGNYTTAVTDAQIAVAGPPLSVTRTYNSLEARTDGIFGAGWSTTWDMKIVAEATSLLVFYPDGRRVRFASKGDGGYQPPPGMHAVLSDVDGGGWRLMDQASTSFFFNAAGRLSKISDARGRAQTLTYGSDGKLGKATGVGGRSLHFTWSGPRVATVSTDPVDGESLTWTYGYEGDNLTQVCAPVAAPNCTGYTYADGSRYRSIVLDSEPVGYWRLGDKQFEPAANETSGVSGQYYDVTVGRPGALEGSTDTAAGFTKSHVELPTYTLARLRDRVSIEGWIKTTQSGMIFSAAQFGYEFGATNPVLYVGTDGLLRGQLGEIRNSAGSWVYNPITSAAPVTDDQWHHVVLNVDGTRQELFLDGQSVGEVTGELYESYREAASIGSGDRASSWSDIPGGPNIRGAFPFKGSIDEFALYGKPLTSAEIQAHYAARAQVPNKLTGMTLPSGRAWASNTYDMATDRLKTHTDRHGGTWNIGKAETDWVNQVATVKVTDPRDGTVTYGYDGGRNFRLVYEEDQHAFKTEFEYDTGGFPSKTTDRNGNVSRRWNDKRGNALRARSCRTGGNCQIHYATYHFNKDDEFDPRNGRQLTFRDARSSSETDDRYVTTYEYNAYGEPTKQTGPVTLDFPTGRSISTAYTDGTEAAVGGETQPAGLLKSRTDARGNSWSYRYTAAGDTAEQTDREGLVTSYAHDGLGRIISQTVTSMANPDGVTKSFAYDGLGRVVSETGAAVKNDISDIAHTPQLRYTYDPDGNLLTETLADLTGGDTERTTTFTYDTHGRIDTETGPEGGVVRNAWDHTGAIVRVTDAVGTVVENGYSTRGELTTRTLKGWTGSPVAPQPARDVVLEAWSYDAAGRLASQVDAMGRKTSYTYFGDNRLSKVTAEGAKLNGSTTARDVVLRSLTYDAAGYLTSEVGGGDTVRTDYVYDAAGMLTSQTFDPSTLRRQTAFAYDGNGNITAQTLTADGSARTESTSFFYNKDDQLIRSTVDNGADDLTTTWNVDDRGLVTQVTDPRGNADGATSAAYATSYRYDTVGQLIEVKAPEVRIEKAGTAEPGRPTTRFGYTNAGEQSHVVDAEGRTTATGYDRAGRATSMTGTSYTPPGGTALTPRTAITYDPAGRVISTTDARSQVTRVEYDALGNAVRITDPAPQGQQAGQWLTEYDLLGEPLATVDPTGARNQSTYDDLGRQITSTQIERRPSNAVYTTKLEYNTAGHLTKVIQPGNKTTTYVPNAAGEAISTTDPLNHTSTAVYDLAGRQIKSSDPLDNATVVEYDLAGRMSTVKDLNDVGSTVRTQSIEYDLASNPIRSTSGEGHTTRRTFDATDKLTEIIEPVSDSRSITTTVGYDATGARTRLTDGRGNTTWTSYNSLGLMETQTEPATTAHPAAADRTWTHAYDAAGNNVGTLEPGGVRVDRTFDHLARLTKVTGSGAEAASADKTYGYDLAGRTITAGDQSLEYNDRGLLTSISAASTPATTYNYDAVGNPLQRVDAAGTATFTWDNANRLATAVDPVTGRTSTYGYDDADRLTRISSTGPTTTQTYAYDAINQPTAHTLKNSTGTQLAKIDYEWDDDGNLTRKTSTGTAGAGSNTYAYDHAGRLTSWTRPDSTVTDYEWDDAGNRVKAGDKTYTYDERNRLTSGDGTDYTYTPRGTLASQTKDGTVTNLTFDAFGQLISDGEATYSYDSLGRMTTRTRGVQVDKFRYSGVTNELAAITNSVGATQARYGRDPFGQLLGLQEGNSPALGVMSDQHGDMVATFTGTALVDSTAYDPFGAVIARTGEQRALGYQGEYTDPDTGKVNMHARWYQPGTGSFASRDDWTLAPSPSVQANRYTYGNANPLRYVDPTGHAPGVPCVPYSIWVQASYSPSPPSGRCPPPPPPSNQPKGGVGTVEPINRSAPRNPKQGNTHNPTPTNPTQTKPRQTNNTNRPKDERPRKKEPWPTPQQIKNDPNNVTVDRDPPTKQEVIDRKCTTGACNVSWSGHQNVIGGTSSGGVTESSGPSSGIRCDGWDCSTSIQPVNLPTDDEICIGYGCENDAPELTAIFTGPSLYDAAKAGYAPYVDIFLGDALGCKDGSAGDCGMAVVGVIPITKMGNLVIRVGEKIGKKIFGKGDVVVSCNSFVPGTEVLMADGTRKRIEDVKVGDKVLATDPETGETRAEPVTALMTSAESKHLVQISLSTGDASSTMVATEGHPFWAPALKQWVNATDLEPGMWLRTSAGTYVQVRAIKQWTAVQRVHNIAVGDLHTYHVVAGDQAILVHNADPGRGLEDDIGLGDGYSGRMDKFNVGYGADFEIHVYRKGREVGVFGSNGWINKHGRGTDIDVPDSVMDRLKGKAVEYMRKTERIGPKGTGDISGDKWQRPRRTGGC
jgi:RHS repeat-associated protein